MKEQQEHQSDEPKYGRSPLDLILNNPKLTPIFLFVLAIAPPFFLAALILTLLYLVN